ncbi:MAG: response regulator [Cyanobacteria bacterium RM1_2_2]|nr:response regulator [Cyanobacteria bacterium RM1_2_2]
MLNRLKIGTKIAASFVFGLGLFTAIATVSYRGINQLIENAQMEAHTYQVLGELDNLNAQLRRAQSEQRAYLITGEQEVLQPYQDAVANLDSSLQKVQQLTADNPDRQQRIEALISLVDARTEVINNRINIRREQGFAAAQQAFRTDDGRELNEQIDQIIAELKQREESLLEERSKAARLAVARAANIIAYSVPLYILSFSTIGFLLSRGISRPLRKIAGIAEQVGSGDLSANMPVMERQDEIGTLNNAFRDMIVSLRAITRSNDEQTWLKSNLTDLTQMLQGQRNLTTVAQLILSKLAPLVQAQQAVFYVLDAETEPPVLKLLSSYAYQERKHLSNQFCLGEGLVGQCALEKQQIVLTEVPTDYIRIRSGLGEATPLNIVVLPVLYEDQVTAVLEFASLQQFSQMHLTLLNQVAQNIGVVLSSIASNTLTAQLLEQSQLLTATLQERQAELEESNQRLEEQAEELKKSEILLKEQQEELQQTNEELQQLNEELEEKAELLAVQKREVEQKNQAIEAARQQLAEKAEQLELSSRYKSEFLANMSHELRTPLNSLLILARLLADNGDNNLTEKQVEYSRTIYSAGNDLLELINDILDLAKIESGMMLLNLESILFADLKTYLERTFGQVADNKALEFRVELAESLPPAIVSDPKRLQQILKNLLANAFKFTEQGSVTLRISTVDKVSNLEADLSPVIAFAVQDTGIGIAPEKQKVIFEAFQQADGTTSRKYGGTGLGLSISRELAHLLGGRIELNSQLGRGSTFTLYLLNATQSGVSQDGQGKGSQDSRQNFNQNFSRDDQESVPQPPPTPADMEELLPSTLPRSSAPLLLPDDRNGVQSDDRVLLIIEDDLNFAKILLDMARKQGFKGIVSLQGGTGLALAQEFKPDAVMLDLRLPDMDGWTILDRLKHNSNTRHIPVHILSVDEEQQRGLQLGAIAYLQKPVSAEAITQALTNIKGFVERRVRQLLVIEDDPVQADSIIELIGNGDVKSTAVHTGAEALHLLRSQVFDCIVLDLGLPDMSGFELLNQIKQESELAKLPIIVYTGKELSRAEETELRRLAETIIVKDVQSPERLLDETALFLHRVQANLPQPKRQILEQLRQEDPVLANKKVLIVDDDVRNIFALTSLLERYQMQVIYAENGREGIVELEANLDTNIVLMDVMMPEMDGYETTQTIRQQSRFRSLPIIALTAKAMQDDREKCLAAGASDYITKPVDTEQLLSLLRVWLYGRE